MIRTRERVSWIRRHTDTATSAPRTYFVPGGTCPDTDGTVMDITEVRLHQGREQGTQQADSR